MLWAEILQDIVVCLLTLVDFFDLLKSRTVALCKISIGLTTVMTPGFQRTAVVYRILQIKKPMIMVNLRLAIRYRTRLSSLRLVHGMNLPSTNLCFRLPLEEFRKQHFE